MLAAVWLAVVLVAAGHLAWRVADGLTFRTDLTALLPREEQNPTLQESTDAVTRALSQRILLLIGHPDREQARAAATEASRRLTAANVAEVTTGGFDQDRLQKLGALYFPYRRGLLADADRERLLAGRGQDLALRALSQVYGFVGMADARLLQQDPFLLLPAFFASLPLPNSKLSLDDGMLAVKEAGVYWTLVAARLTGEPYALAVQDQLVAALALDQLAAAHPGLQTLRLGAVFFARAGAKSAMSETSAISVASTIGAVLLVLAVFRAASPLWLCLLVITVGVLSALSASLWFFGDLHIGALLFGVSLIGVAVDYGIQYCAENFGVAAPASDRLRRVFMAITVGAATTVVGYLTLFLAPFPGLHQIAAFSVVGLVAAWLTVVLWAPILDRSAPPRHGRRMLIWANAFAHFWDAPRHARRRIALVAIAILAGGFGLSEIRPDDNVRRMQSLSVELVGEQARMQAMIGAANGGQFFVVDAPDVETALEREEALIKRLTPLVAARDLGGFQASAQFAPSKARQLENRALVRDRLDAPLLADQVRQLGLASQPTVLDDDSPTLTLSEAARPESPLAFLTLLTPAAPTGGRLHLVMLEGVARADRMAEAAEGIEGVRFVDPASDFSRLLGKYRGRAIALLALSAALMAPILLWRYGVRRGLSVLLPPLLAVALAPALRALLGGGFSFFDAMALVLVLSIGVDYSVFYAESSSDRKGVTMIAVATAACTTLMSFGLLALSSVLAVHSFGATMTVGVLLAFLFAPMARRIDA